MLFYNSAVYTMNTKGYGTLICSSLRSKNLLQLQAFSSEFMYCRS